MKRIMCIAALVTFFSGLVGVVADSPESHRRDDSAALTPDVAVEGGKIFEKTQHSDFPPSESVRNEKVGGFMPRAQAVGTYVWNHKWTLALTYLALTFPMTIPVNSPELFFCFKLMFGLLYSTISWRAPLIDKVVAFTFPRPDVLWVGNWLDGRYLGEFA